MEAGKATDASTEFLQWLDLNAHVDVQKELVPRLGRLGGRSCARVALQALGHLQDGRLRECSHLGHILAGVAWEKLHIGFWKDVDVAWRDAYTLGKVLAAVPFLHGLEDFKRRGSWCPSQCSRVEVSSEANGREGAMHPTDLQQRRDAHASTPNAPSQDSFRQVGDCPHYEQVPKRRKLAASGVENVGQSCNQEVSLGNNDPSLVDEDGSEVGSRMGHGPLKASGNSYAVEDATKEATDLLRELDMGAIMGGPMFRLPLDSAINAVQRFLSQHQPPMKMGNLTFEDSFLEQKVVPLPPRSLNEVSTSSLDAKDLPSLECFLESYMAPGGKSKPVVLTGCMEGWPALKKWCDAEYLISVAGHRTVPIEEGRHYLSDKWSQRLMTLSEFVEKYMHPSARIAWGTEGEAGDCADTRGYLAQHPLFDQIPALLHDIRTPEYCMLGKGEMQSVNAWFGPPETITPLHYDAHHNLLGQVVGRKYVRLYAPELSSCLAPRTEELTMNSSQVDLDCPDALDSPEFKAAPFVDCVLEPGQMLYIPPRWWHYVKSLSISFSVSFWWQ
ncbi:unnamed protein product [Ostreobium quekettii]|uniref:JmjC domain-containing protein n=1 Tax=Ostreobium quekettii TaxID=121088 RepID=A0A8S1JB47_9CHLO|nr:unnamed protein product [Ostreobium quekettii]|eukprot:evm.model.scf_97.12 EVM.evm.TU.scf_97.12   scf_97:135063-136733(-)